MSKNDFEITQRVTIKLTQMLKNREFQSKTKPWQQMSRFSVMDSSFHIGSSCSEKKIKSSLTCISEIYVSESCPLKAWNPPYCIIGIRLGSALSMPIGPSCGTSAENRGPIVCCWNPTQWLRLKAVVLRGLCGPKYKQWATTKARGQLGPQFNVVYTKVASFIREK